MVDVSSFLRDRDVPELLLERFKEEKIDAGTVASLDDETLAKYVPKLGDRVALRNFCDQQAKQSTQKSTKRTHLFEVLKRKINKIDDSSAENEEPTDISIEMKGKGKQNRKITRRIEIGWIHEKKQVRKRTGGGTRKIDVARTDKKADLLREGKRLFFPDGISSKGPVSEFELDILDFKETPLPADVTISECYELFKTGILTFYLHTFERSNSMPERQVGKPDDTPSTSTLDTSNLDLQDVSSDTSLHAEIEHTSINEVKTANQDVARDKVPVPVSDPQITSDILSEAASVIYNDFDLPDLDDPEIFFNFENKDNTVVPQFALLESLPQLQASVEITIHRGALAFTEMCNNFKDPSIVSKCINVIRVLPNGEIERAEDVGGVLKDTITEFWESFYDKCTIGRATKVPCLRHDFGEEEWKAIGRVLAFGWKELHYWPIKLSKTFMSNCLFPHHIIPSDRIMEDFYNFTSRPDAEILQNAEKDFANVDHDAIIDALDSYDCRTKISSENFKAVLLEIAHREIIQSPCYVAECWKEAIQINTTVEKILDIYLSLVPTNLGVVQRLSLPDGSSNTDANVFRFLKRYVKELDEAKLRSFLRFCCGSDLLNMEKIDVQFVDMREFERRPVGHTCGCLLQLGGEYTSYMEFRSEFDHVLESNVWVMDVI